MKKSMLLARPTLAELKENVTLNDKPINKHSVDSDSELFSKLESIAHELEQVNVNLGGHQLLKALHTRMVDVLKDIEPSYDYSYQDGGEEEQQTPEEEYEFSEEDFE
jgi:hypothetical protein